MYFKTPSDLLWRSQKNLSTVISKLVRRGLNVANREASTENGFPLFDVSKTARALSLEDIKRAEEDDDQQHLFGVNQ